MGLRDNVAHIRIAHPAKLAIGSGYLPRAPRVEKLPPPERPAQGVGHRSRGLQVAAEIAVALLGGHYLVHGYAGGGCRPGAPLAELLHINKEESLFLQQRTAQVPAELVLVVLRRACLPSGDIGI